MKNRFSFRVQQAIQFAREEALRLGHDSIGTEHLLLGIIRLGEGSAVRILQSLGGQLDEIRETIEEAIDTPSTTMKMGNIPFTKRAEKALKVSYIEGKAYAAENINTAHLLLALVKDEEGLAAQVLASANITYDAVKAELDNMQQEDAQSSEEIPMKSSSKSKTPVLDHFGRDLTKLARNDELDPIIGRDKEIERVAQILSRRKKNNPVLIGEPGVGKNCDCRGPCPAHYSAESQPGAVQQACDRT